MEMDIPSVDYKLQKELKNLQFRNIFSGFCKKPKYLREFEGEKKAFLKTIYWKSRNIDSPGVSFCYKTFPTPRSFPSECSEAGMVIHLRKKKEACQNISAASHARDTIQTEFHNLNIIENYQKWSYAS